MSKPPRTGCFCFLAAASLLAGGWLAYQGVRFRSHRLASIDPAQSITVDAAVIDRRQQGQDHDVKLRFRPVGPKTSPVTSLWMGLPKDVYESLPASEATVPLVYLKAAPEWHDLKANVEKVSWPRDTQLGFMALITLGLVLPCAALAWGFWVCFGMDHPPTIFCKLGCLNDRQYGYSGGAVNVTMTYQTVPRIYHLDSKTHVNDEICAFCSKPVKLRINSAREARLPAPGIWCMAAVSGFMIACATQAFWEACPAWLPFVLVVSGIAVGGITFWHSWNWPAVFMAVTLVEGKGNVVHSKTGSDGKAINWYEHEVLK